jgi:hypothetical protein
MTVRHWINQSGIALFALLAVLLTASSVRAQQCSAKTTVGRYVVVCEGYLTPGPNAPLTVAKELAVVTADATGTFKGTGTLSLGGAIVEQAVNGVAVISSDCTGTITYHQTIDGQPVPDFHDTFVITEGGDRIDGMATDPGSVFSCRLLRISEE